ncbi:MAG TPA: translation initiation factor IF-2 [Epulopiscium sp.]|nr:translation initiation factor IF-2 [Candidatus Epulonipiscium sp.]
MSKVRVYELAKQLEISSKEVIEKLKSYDVNVHSHMSTLEAEQADLIIKHYSKDQVTNNKISKDEPKNMTNKTNVTPKTQIEEPIEEVIEEVIEEELVEEIEDEEDFVVVEIPASIAVKDLAEKLSTTAVVLITSLMDKGIMATINQEIDFETASILAGELDILLELEETVDLLEEIFTQEPEKEEDLVSRPPVVVVMGHVDHGKTSLLDALRSSKVTEKEAGGITQHIGASTIPVGDQIVTFLDTPGHEAFTAMRMRGAQVTDIAILVVASDDGVMPQTVEAINHAKAAGIQIIVAINKMDKASANPDRVKQELADHGLLVEEWGGETICVPVSALTGDGLDTLLEMILLVAEMNEYKANPNKKARGTIIESELDKGRGPVATVLVQEGTLKVGDPIVAGLAYGRIRAMIDDKGKSVKKATPSMPVEVLGLSEVPIAGDMFYVAASDKQARQVAEKVKAQGRNQLMVQTPSKVSLDDLFTQIQAGKVKDLNIIVKADVQGSVEAVRQSLEKLSNEEVRIRIIHGGVGAVTESDVILASASNAIIIGFNVRPDSGARSVADHEEVDVRLYRVIYNAIEDIEAAMKGMLDPEYKEKVIGHVEVRQTFKISSMGTIAGSHVIDGKITRHSQVRIVRDGIVVYEGNLTSLKRFKDDAKEVNTGYECGLMFERFNDVKEGDVVEAFIMEEIPR